MMFDIVNLFHQQIILMDIVVVSNVLDLKFLVPIFYFFLLSHPINFDNFTMFFIVISPLIAYLYFLLELVFSDSSL